MNFEQLKAWLSGSKPDVRLAYLHQSGELARVLPEVDCLYGIPQPAQWHPEICTGKHMELCLQVAAYLTSDVAVRFAVLVHDLGKGLTPAAELPRHVDHEISGLLPVAVVCDRFGVPNDWRTLALLVCEHHQSAHKALDIRPGSVARFLQKAGLDKDERLLSRFLLACEADARGREGLMTVPYHQAQYLRRARAALEANPFPEGVHPGDVAAQRTIQARVFAIARVREDFNRYTTKQQFAQDAVS